MFLVGHISPIISMNILLNDNKQPIDKATTVSSLVKTHGSNDGGFAVAVNDTFIPRSDYENTILNDGDRVELLIPMQGG